MTAVLTPTGGNSRLAEDSAGLLARLRAAERCAEALARACIALYELSADNAAAVQQMSEAMECFEALTDPQPYEPDERDYVHATTRGGAIGKISLDANLLLLSAQQGARDLVAKRRRRDMPGNSLPTDHDGLPIYPDDGQ